MTKLTDQYCWLQETLYDIYDTVNRGEVPKLDFDRVPYWFPTHLPEQYERKKINEVLALLYQKKGIRDFWWALGGYERYFQVVEEAKTVSTKATG